VDKTSIILDCPVPPAAAAVAALLLLAGAAVFLRKDVRRLKGATRKAIVALMLVAGVMLAGVALNPKLIRTWPDPHNPRCVILVDGSRSMLLADSYAGKTAQWLKKRGTGNPVAEGDLIPRDDLVRMLLAHAPGGWLELLDEEFTVSGSRFSSALAGLPLGAEAAPFEVDEDGFQTPLGDALKLAGESGGGTRPRAIVLVSDGAWNTGADPSAVARVLGDLGTPVFAVGVGNPKPPRDIALVSLSGPKTSLLGDAVSLAAQVATSGMGASRVTVELKCDGKMIDQKRVVTNPAGGPVGVTFTHVPEKPGRRLFAASIEPQQGEHDDSNNRATATVSIVERKISVLLAEGDPRWEFRFLRNVLERDPAVDLDVCLLRPGVGAVAGEGYVGALPIEKKELAKYDLMILGDVPRRLLPNEFLSGAADAVRQRAAALIALAGRRGHYRELVGTPLAEILPVAIEGAPPGPAAGAVHFAAELTQEGGRHLMTRLASDAVENGFAWSSLPRLAWSADVASLARGATALLVHPYRLAGGSKLPLICVQRVGAGKVMFCGIDETWRWRKAVGDKYHYRFWAQAVRWMVKKQFAEGDMRARLSLDRTECGVGEQVEIEAYCLDEDGYPLEGATVQIAVAREDGPSRIVAMQPAPGGWGIYRANLAPSAPGTYRLRPIVSTYGTAPLPSSATLSVTRADMERNALAQDVVLLRSIAQASGGEYLEAGDIDRLPGLVAGKVEKRILTAEYSPCRHWAYYAALTALLSTAWLTKKRSGLA